MFILHPPSSSLVMTAIITAIKTAAAAISLTLLLVYSYSFVADFCGAPPHIVFIALFRLVARTNSVWSAILLAFKVLLAFALVVNIAVDIALTPYIN